MLANDIRVSFLRVKIVSEVYLRFIIQLLKPNILNCHVHMFTFYILI